MSKVLTLISNLVTIAGFILLLGLLSIGLDYMKEEGKSGAPLIEPLAPSDGGGASDSGGLGVHVRQ